MKIAERFRLHAAGRVARSPDMPYRRKAEAPSTRTFRPAGSCATTSHLIGFLRDVTERRQAEGALRTEKETLGGHAQIESRPGNGTCITVDLPLLARDDDE